MTEHRKAVENRKRDLEAHHEHVHNYSHRAIAGGVMIVNIAEIFNSPTRAESDITTHLAKVEHCMAELRAVSSRGGPTGYGLDAKAGLVVEMDNLDLSSTRYWEKHPAPTTGDPLHYDAFIQRLCSAYESRYAQTLITAMCALNKSDITTDGHPPQVERINCRACAKLVIAGLNHEEGHEDWTGV